MAATNALLEAKALEQLAKIVKTNGRINRATEKA